MKLRVSEIQEGQEYHFYVTAEIVVDSIPYNMGYGHHEKYEMVAGEIRIKINYINSETPHWEASNVQGGDYVFDPDELEIPDELQDDWKKITTEIENG